MNKTFEYKELDVEGLDTLDSVGAANKFNRWMYDTVTPYLNGDILEVGSGIGNISKYFIEEDKDIVLSDIRENYRSHLSKTFKTTQVIDLDIVKDDFDVHHKELIGRFDSIFALNVVEHIEDDRLALANCYKMLKPGGHLVILVPAYQSLYNNFDTALDHYRRYTLTSLKQIFPSGCENVHSQYFNFIGIFGWYFSGKILGKKIIPKGQMSLYNLLVPIFRVIDKIILNKMGLSVICVARKT